MLNKLNKRRGDSYKAQTVDTLPKVPTDTFTNLSDVAGRKGAVSFLGVDAPSPCRDSRQKLIGLLPQTA